MRIDWPARLWQRIGGKAPAPPGQARPYRLSSDKDLLEAADTALRSVIDPELGINIVDLGLVYRLKARDGMVEADIGLTSPSCPLADHIVGQACQAIREALGGEVAVKVRLDRERRWSADMMSPAARRQLGRD